jgi:hypothetical protein
VFYIYVVEQILDSASTFHALIFGFVSCLVSSLLILILLAPRTYALVFPASCVLTEAVGPNVGHIWELVSGASASCVSCLRFSSAASSRSVGPQSRASFSRRLFGQLVSHVSLLRFAPDSSASLVEKSPSLVRLCGPVWQASARSTRQGQNSIFVCSWRIRSGSFCDGAGCSRQDRISLPLEQEREQEFRLHSQVSILLQFLVCGLLQQLVPVIFLSHRIKDSGFLV